MNNNLINNDNSNINLHPNTESSQLHNKNQEICTICTNELAGKNVFKTDCSHLFHRECLSDLVITHDDTKCPNCRVKITDRDVKALNALLDNELCTESIKTLYFTIKDIKQSQWFEDNSERFQSFAQVLESLNVPINQLTKSTLQTALLASLDQLTQPPVCDAFAQILKLIEILFQLGGKVPQDKLNNILLYAYKNTNTAYFPVVRTLHKLGGALTQQQLHEQFYLVTNFVTIQLVKKQPIISNAFLFLKFAKPIF